MFGGGNAGDKLMAALEAYQKDFAARIKTTENPEAKKAAALVSEARNIIDRTGLGAALAPTLMEHVEHWPAWSKRDDFQEWVGFPARDIAASENRTDPKVKIAGVLFTYENQRYGLRTVNTGYHSLPDGELRKRHHRIVGQWRDRPWSRHNARPRRVFTVALD